MRSELLLDTNILLDIAISSRPQHTEAMRLCQLCAEGKIRCHITPNSLEDFFYIAAKPRGIGNEKQLAWQTIRAFLQLFHTLTVGETECRIAAQATEADMDDGIIAATAQTNRITRIVTRDRKAFRGSRAEACDAAQWLASYDRSM